MTEPLDLPAITARCEAATPGPWQYGYDNGDGHVKLTDEFSQGGTIISLAQQNPTPVSGCSFGIGCGAGSDEDATFIAHARTDIPALIARVEELEAEVERLQASIVTTREAISKGFAGRALKQHKKRYYTTGEPKV